MSRIGRRPIPVPSGVTVDISEGNLAQVHGPRGELTQQLPREMTISRQDDHLVVERPSDSHTHRALHGLTRSLLANMVQGVHEGFQKRLEIVGVGYRAQQAGNKVVMQLGFSHPVEVDPLPGVTLTVEAATRISVSGIDKQRVGEAAAQIRAIRKPEPYKGKGIRYEGEHVRRKAGKAGKVGGKKR